MNILVLNGSPKGDNSVTMSSVKYLKVVFPEHDFQIKHVAQSLHRLEKDRGAFDELINDVRNSEVILWAFPLYFLLVHSNYKRFIELIFEREVQSAFHGKYTASFSTSIHFYDHTAHNYIRGICEDLEMHFVRSFSADMRDLMDKQERKNLENFAGDLIDSCKKQVKSPRSFPKLIQTELAYKPSNTAKQVDSGNLKLIVLTDTGSMTDNLRNMLHRFQSSFLKKPDIIDLSDIKINGGCLGCLKCGMDNECAYDGKDDVRVTYEDKLKKADVIVFAFAMKDRYFSARWKSFLDRRFYQTHQPGFPGKQIGYLISGPLSYEQNLRQILLALAELDQVNLVDVITDEATSSPDLDFAIFNFAENLIKSVNLKVKQPRTFLGVGAAKLFRDEVWGNLRFVFQADYRYYKRHGMMDFPQAKVSTGLMHLFIPFTRLGPVKKQIQANMTVMMHRAHDQVVKQEAEMRKKQELKK